MNFIVRQRVETTQAIFNSYKFYRVLFILNIFLIDYCASLRPCLFLIWS